MLLRVLCVCVSVVGALTLSGCAVLPLPDQVTREATLAIVTAIRCEAQAAVLEYAPGREFDQGAIGFVFKFDITEHNHAALDLAFQKTFPHGTFELNFGGSTAELAGNTDLTRQATRNFTVVDTFAELKLAKCSPEALRSRFDYPIAGSIGLNEVIRTAIGIDQLGSIRQADGAPGGIGPPSDVAGGAAVFSDMLQYQTTFDTVHITPKVTLDEVPGVLRLTSASADVFSNRKDIHTLTLAIALPEPAKPTPKAQVRAAARTALLTAAMAPTWLVASRGMPSTTLHQS